MTAQARIAQLPLPIFPTQPSESYTATTPEQAWNSLDPYQKSVVSRTLVRLIQEAIDEYSREDHTCPL